MLRVEIQRQDVFILLRRIFGKLDGSVRLPFEPFWVGLDVRMIG